MPPPAPETPAAAPEHPPVTVTVQTDNGKTYSRQFHEAVTIGRDDHCTVRLNDEAISRVHAELFHDGCNWFIRDLGSSNGTLLNGRFVTEAALDGQAVVQFGPDGPVIRVEPEAAEPTTSREAEAPAPVKPPASIDDIARHYFDERSDHEAGDHTMMVRRAFQQVKKKQKRRYYGVIAVVGLFLIASIGVGIYQHLRLQKAQQVAIEIFYNMKSVGLQIAQIESLIRETGETGHLGEVQAKRRQVVDMERQYDQFLQEFGVMDEEMSEQDRIIMRMARLFGECELNMPDGFRREVKRYIAQWQQSGRLEKAIATLRENDYMPVIFKAMVDNHMPPQFMYLALQESNFNRRAVGPPTRFGIAKGIWQFIPSTARQYGLRTGPLVELPRFDPRDERFNFYKATNAAASFIRDIYNTDAQASGLLVMASYNWGPNNIRKRITEMPENPRERNFWKLLEQYKIPKETYDYVFYIFSASVIGENPRLFGFDFDNPLDGMGDMT
jgi:pSer/pThr/pTyr-binding forkhead associated (FHA) protein/soluble lytic murein transglycosylase-like protein